MIGSNSSAKHESYKEMKFSYNVSIDLFGVQMVTPESKPVVPLDWCLMNRENNLELFMNFKFQKRVIVLAGKDFLTVYTSN